jgi:DNA-binding response OmpR family regulator
LVNFQPIHRAFTPKRLKTKGKSNGTPDASSQEQGFKLMSADISNRDERRMRILVLDDEDAVLRVNAETLRAAGFYVDARADGEAGWVAICSHDYDLIVTDNNMPNLSGVELVRRLRKTGSRTPVILVSGSYRVEDDPELDLAAILQKPYHLYELASTARRALAGIRLDSTQRESASIFSMRHSPLLLPPRG